MSEKKYVRICKYVIVCIYCNSIFETFSNWRVICNKCLLKEHKLRLRELEGSEKELTPTLAKIGVETRTDLEGTPTDSKEPSEEEDQEGKNNE